MVPIWTFPLTFEGFTFLHEWYLFHLPYLIELSPWTNFTDCSEDIVCNGNGKRYRNRSCDHDHCCDNGISYKKGDQKIDFQDCQFTCASKVHLLFSFRTFSEKLLRSGVFFASYFSFWKFQFPKLILHKKWINQKLTNLLKNRNTTLFSYKSALEKVRII